MKNEAQNEEPKLVHIHVDPLNVFTSTRPTRLLETCGYLPGWVTERTTLHMPLREALDKWYQFGLFEMDGTVEADGTYKYPGDPDLQPYVRIDRGDETFFQYPHAIVAIIASDGTAFITRID